jgi:multiple sugar transport system substrate-binding protein
MQSRTAGTAGERTAPTRRTVLASSGVLGASGALFAACSGPGGGPGGAPAPQSKAPVTLSWLIRTDMGPIMADWHERAASGFKSQQPNVTVETAGATSGDYNTKATAMFAGGTPPDVLGNNAGGFGTFVVNGWMADVLPYVNRDKLDLKGFEPAALDSIRREGKLYGLPVGHNPWVIFVNRSLLQERGAALPPTSWKDRRWTLEALAKTAGQVTSRSDDPATAVWGVIHPEGQLGTQAAWFWGADPFNNTGGPEKSTAYQTAKVTTAYYVQPKVVEAIQANVDLMHRQRVAPTPVQQTPFAAGRASPLHTGRLGLWANGAWNLRTFKEAEVPFKWGVAPLTFGGGATAANTTGLFNDSFHVVKGTKAADAAFVFVAYLATGDRASGYTEGAGTFPANRQLYESWYDTQLKIPNLAMTKAELKDVMEGSMAAGFASPGKTLHRQRDLVGAFGQAFTPIRNGDQPAATGLRDVQTQIEAVAREG